MAASGQARRASGTPLVVLDEDEKEREDEERGKRMGSKRRRKSSGRGDGKRLKGIQRFSICTERLKLEFEFEFGLQLEGS